MVCLDEAGRGPLCGPVVACAVVVLRTPGVRNLKDSKKLTPKARDKFYKILTTDSRIWWAAARVSEKVIDKINILEATKLAMIRAVRNLEKKLIEVRPPEEVGPHKIDFLILDGKMKLDLPIFQRSIVKADEKDFSCAAASIIAKVTRDRIMKRYHKKYPRYGFDKHMGYPTKFHRKMLKKYGSCKIHRKSFGPVKRLQNEK